MFETVSIADIARVLNLSQATVRHWVRERRWPTGRVMRGMKLSDSPAADIRIFKEDFLDYVRECARDFNPESAELVAEKAKRELKPKLSAREQRKIASEVAALKQMRQRRRIDSRRGHISA